MMRAWFIALIFAACSDTKPATSVSEEKPYEPEVWPWPAADVRPTTLSVTVQPGPLEPQDEIMWPAKGVWPSSMLGDRLLTLLPTWPQSDVERRRILAEDYPKLRAAIGTVAMEISSVRPIADDASGIVRVAVDLDDKGYGFAVDDTHLMELVVDFGAQASPALWTFAIEVPTGEAAQLRQGGFMVDGIFTLGEARVTGEGITFQAKLHAVRLRSVARKEILYDSIVTRALVPTP